MLEFMEEGIMTTVIGMGVVFIVLIILSLLIGWLNSGVEAMMGKKPKQQEKAAVPVMPEKAPAESVSKVEGISPAVVAAITASICAITGKSSEEFKFTKIRRISEVKPVWSMVGTQDIMLTRQRFIERGNK